MRRYAVTALALLCLLVIAVRLGCQTREFAKERGKVRHALALIERREYEALDAFLGGAPSIVNARIAKYSQPLLSYCVERGDLAGTQVFLSRGADPDRSGFSRCRALHLAVLQNRSDLALLLLSHRADVDAAGYRHDETPLHVASSHNLVAMVNLLGDHGARIDSRNMQQETPLMRAVQNGHIEVVRVLLQRGANPNLLDQRRRSALDFALKNGNQQIVALLRRAETARPQPVSSDESK